MGFADELEEILAAVPGERQTALFSATMARRILEIAKRHLREPVRVTIAAETVAKGEAPRVRELAYIVQRRHKAAALARVLDMEAPTSVIVFCRTRIEVDELTETLGGRGYSAEALHGGLSQEQRDRVLRRFRDGASEILVATDVAARGLDIEHVSHVVNFDVPSSPDAYVHRIGRTGRAGREGVAVTLAEAREHRLLRNIEQHTKRKISIESVPTVHDLRARRLDLTRAALEEALEGGGLDAYRRVVEALAEEHDVLDLAAAAVKLADSARDGAAADEEEIPAVAPPPTRQDGPQPFMRARGAREPREPRPFLAAGRGPGGERPSGERPGGERPSGERPTPPARGFGDSRDVAKIYIGVGRAAGIRPADLVGAIANEARISSRDIGAIDIADKFSLVEVPGAIAEGVIAALRGATIRGKKVTVRRDRGK
jgi:ATP-dependent RNA helicase DeaD